MIWEKAMWEWEKKWNSVGIRTSVINNVWTFTVDQFFSFEKLFAFSLPKNLRKKCLFHKKRLNVLKFTRNLLKNFLHVMNLKLTNFVTSLRGFLKKKKKNCSWCLTYMPITWPTHLRFKLTQYSWCHLI